MLTIRPEQMAIFGDASTRQLEEGMLRSIREGFSDKFAELGENGVLEYIRNTRTAASRVGISGPAVALLILLKLEFGETFELSPDREWARKMLAHPTIPGETKVIEMTKRLASGTDGRRLVRQPPIR
jgi:hypothetical protein